MNSNARLPHFNTSSIMVMVPPRPRTPPRRQRHDGIGSIPPPNVYDLYPPRLSGDARIPVRVNPTHPDPPERRTISLETEAANWQNNYRSELMTRREHHRYHTAWSRYYYGNPSEKEIYRRNIRECLKQQMEERDQRKRDQLVAKVRESEIAVERDREDILKDITSSRNKKMFLTQYRDANKEMMENSEVRRRQNTAAANHREQEILQYNPINWSRSLK